MEELNISLAKAFNIFRKHLGRRSLHLSEHGTSRVAMNCNAAIRKLLYNVDYTKCDFDLKPVGSTKTFQTIGSNCEENPLEILKRIE